METLRRLDGDDTELISGEQIEEAHGG